MNLRQASFGLTLLVASSLPCSANILIVNPDGTGGFPTIEAAIEAAVEGDTVMLGEGVFTGAGNRNLNFGGKNLVLKSMGGSASTIVDLGGFVVGNNEVNRFLTLQNAETSEAVVEGVTIRNCLFQEDGGAFLINRASPVIRDVVFDAFQTSSPYDLHLPIHEIRGGAIFVGAGAPTISDCVFQDFRMPNGRGGAIYANGAGPIVVERCTFRDNAVLYYVVSLTNGHVVDCLFENNFGAFEPWGNKASDGQHQRRSETRGNYWISTSPLGAFVGPVRVRSCTFTENQALDGGAISAFGSVLVEDCYFWGNGADIGGAAYAGDGAILNRCKFASNGALAAGTVNWYGSGEMNQCLVVESWDSEDGAVSIDAWPNSRPQHSRPQSETRAVGEVRITESTICKCKYAGIYGSFLVENSIIAFNDGPAINCEDGAPVLTCCDLFGNQGGDWRDCMADQLGENGNISADPLFCDPNTDNFALFSNSPCAPANSGGCGLIGAYDVGCEARINVGADPRFQTKSWGAIKGLYR